MTDPNETAIEDLELSVRSSMFLQELGVATVGELLALPTIRAPRLVVAELSELLSELGVPYPGTWETPATPALVEATGSVEERWQTIATWLADNHPAARGSFRPPADPSAIAEAERALGKTLPDDYRAFLRLHDGQEALGPMVAFCTLLPVAELAPESRSLAELLGEGGFDSSEVDTGIAPVAWDPGWVVIGRFNRSALVLDLAPAEGGTRGQIFTLHVDDDHRRIVAASFSDLLARFFREVQDGTIDLEDEDALDEDED